MFQVSFDDISDMSWAAGDKTAPPPPDLDFVNDLGALMDTDFSFPEVSIICVE
jgi:hypothetical protein